jgi:hypothetical protein
MSNIQPSGFAGDHGGADPDVEAALAAYAEGGSAYAVLVVLAKARLLIPVVAVLGDTEAGRDELVRDKSADVAVVFFEHPDGRRALLAFTSVAAMSSWNPDARPQPMSMADAARAALDEGADALLVDLEGPVRFAIEAAELSHLAARHFLAKTASGFAWLALP